MHNSQFDLKKFFWLLSILNCTEIDVWIKSFVIYEVCKDIRILFSLHTFL